MDVRGALQEPDQLAHHGREQHLLGGDQRKALPEIVPALCAEQRDRAGAGAIGPALAVVEHVAKEIEIRPHLLRIADTSDIGFTRAVPQAVTTRELLARYDGILLDAFGVLVDASGALPGAPALIAELHARGTPYAIVSNDASRSRETFAQRFAAIGLPVPPERFVTAGTLLPDCFRERGLAGARTLVLGTPDSLDFVREGGGVPVPVEVGIDVDAVAVCDDDGTPFLDGIEIALSAIVRAVRAGRRPALIAPNPDIIYPKARGELGFTAGAMAVMIELALERTVPSAKLAFERLGKPHPFLMLAAAKRLGIAPDRLVMVGDQLETDVAGALAAHMHVALVAGVSHWEGHATIAPTYLLGTIEP